MYQNCETWVGKNMQQPIWSQMKCIFTCGVGAMIIGIGSFGIIMYKNRQQAINGCIAFFDGLTRECIECGAPNSLVEPLRTWMNQQFTTKKIIEATSKLTAASAIANEASKKTTVKLTTIAADDWSQRFAEYILAAINFIKAKKGDEYTRKLVESLSYVPLLNRCTIESIDCTDAVRESMSSLHDTAANGNVQKVLSNSWMNISLGTTIGFFILVAGYFMRDKYKSKQNNITNCTKCDLQLSQDVNAINNGLEGILEHYVTSSTSTKDNNNKKLKNALELLKWLEKKSVNPDLDREDKEAVRISLLKCFPIFIQNEYFCIKDISQLTENNLIAMGIEEMNLRQYILRK